MPERFIGEIGEEIWEGMRVCAEQARNTYLGPSKTAAEEARIEAEWLKESSTT